MSEHRWKKGQSGNPKGRPKSLFNWQRAIVQQAAELHPTDYKGRTWGERVVANIFRIAANGRPSKLQARACEYLIDRGAGKAMVQVAIADMRQESREQLIQNILESAQIAKEDEKLPIQ